MSIEDKAVVLALIAIQEILADLAPGHTVALDDINEALITLRAAIKTEQPK